MADRLALMSEGPGNQASCIDAATEAIGEESPKTPSSIPSSEQLFPQHFCDDEDKNSAPYASSEDKV